MLSFEKMYKMLDESYSRPAAPTYATELRTLFGGSSTPIQQPAQTPTVTVPSSPVAIDRGDTEGIDQPVDVLADMEQKAIDARRKEVSAYAERIVHIHIKRATIRDLIGTDGTIQSLQIVSGDPMFLRSALDAVQQWHYKPTILNGQPVEIDTYITVVYTMQH